ncbi:hypothetical protein NOGI109294_07955 [Nocardiopsis gilva]
MEPKPSDQFWKLPDFWRFLEVLVRLLIDVAKS